MKRAVALLAVCLLAGCGSDAKAPAGTDAAELVPPDAVAFVSVDGDESGAWRTVYDLPAAGETYAWLDSGEVVAIVKPESGYPSLLRKERRRYPVERIGDWEVVAESPRAFAAVRAAESGRSLAETAAFREATAGVSDDAFATVYGDSKLLGGWIGAGLFAEGRVARIEALAEATAPVYRPRLLSKVPSGALLAISFKDGHELMSRLAVQPFLREYRGHLLDLVPALRGEGVLYLTQGVLLPTIVLELESGGLAAASALERQAEELREETNGILDLEVAVRGNRVLLTNGPLWPTPARRLVDAATFKDALAAADAPEEVSWLAYADIQRLAPILQGLSQLLTGRSLSEEQRDRLDQLGTLVAFGAGSRLAARTTVR